MAYDIETGIGTRKYYWSMPVLDRIRSSIPETNAVLLPEEVTKKVIGNGDLKGLLGKVRGYDRARLNGTVQEALCELEGILDEAVQSGSDLQVRQERIRLSC